MPPSDLAAPSGHSARATSSSESRYRICAPNSLPRRVLVVAVDRPASRLIGEFADRPWGNAVFVSASVPTSPSGSGGKPRPTAVLSDLAGGARDLGDEVAGADLVVLVATAGQDTQAAYLVGRAVRAAGVTTTTALVVDDGTADALQRAAGLAALRPYCHMLVTMASDDAPAAALSALRA